MIKILLLQFPNKIQLLLFIQLVIIITLFVNRVDIGKLKTEGAISPKLLMERVLSDKTQSFKKMDRFLFIKVQLNNHTQGL